jgi:hydrogenase maturation factor HypE
MIKKLSKKQRARMANETNALIEGIVNETIDLPDNALVIDLDTLLQLITPKTVKLFEVFENKKQGLSKDLRSAIRSSQVLFLVTNS